MEPLTVERVTLFLNLADDPIIECIITQRIYKSNNIIDEGA
jgi:vacuolar-type H+-ATPase subunit B/Vma2